MKLNELFLNRFLYKDTSQDMETKSSEFLSADSTPDEPASIPSGGAAQDINTSNVLINGAQLEPGTFPTTVLDVSNWGWGQTCAFTSTDLDTVSWGAGTFTSADGNAYSISAGNTGDMTAKTYIYLSLLESETEYQTSTTSSDSVGLGKVLIAVAENAAVSATFMLSEATQIVGDNILANTIDASKITVGQLSAISADLGSITAGELNINDNFLVNPTGDTILRSYSLLAPYTAGENLTAGRLLCLKQKDAVWGDDDGADRDTTAIFTATGFVGVSSNSANTNYDGDVLIEFGYNTDNGDSRFIYGKIDLSSNPPGLPAWNEIDRVLLRIYIVLSKVYSAVGTVSRLTASFDESTITWNNKPADDGIVWATAQTGTAVIGEIMATTNDGTTTGYLDFDITELYRLWSAGKLDNYGFVIETVGSSHGSSSFQSVGGRTRTGGGILNQAPCIVARILKDAPGSGNPNIVANDGKVYLSSNIDYNKVKNIIGIAGETVSANESINVYALADRSIVPTSVISTNVGSIYYLNGTDGTISKITNDIPQLNKWSIPIGIGVPDGISIDLGKQLKFIKSVVYPDTGILPPPHAKVAIIKWNYSMPGVSDIDFAGSITLYKDRVNTGIWQHDYPSGDPAQQRYVTATWADGTSGLLTITFVDTTGTMDSKSATIYWYS